MTHTPTHTSLQVKSGSAGTVYDTRTLRWYVKEKKLTGGHLQYNLYVEHEENATLAWRNKGRILRVLNRKKNFQTVELCCDTGSFMVALDNGFAERFPPELRTELA